MAIVHKQSSKLARTAMRHLISAGLIFFAGLIVMRAINILLGFIILMAAFIFTRKYLIVRAGVKGERQTLRVLSKLPSDIHVFNNVNLANAELDFVIVGQSGIFVVENKHHRGTIVGNEHDERWMQYKVGRKGGHYQKQMYNPTKQVGTHVYKLAQQLKTAHIGTWIQGVVFFSNPDCTVQAHVQKIPVIDHPKTLLQYITTYQPAQKMKDASIEQVVSVLCAAGRR